MHAHSPPWRPDPAEAVTLILNYLVAYQTMHRSAQVKAGDKVLIIGQAAGLGRHICSWASWLSRRTYGIASGSKHAILTEYGATPIDYHTQDFVAILRRAEPDGLDAVFDGVGGDYLERLGFPVPRRARGIRRGTAIPRQFCMRLPTLLGQVLVAQPCCSNGRSAKLDGTSASRLMAEHAPVPGRPGDAVQAGRIGGNMNKPVITGSAFPSLEAAHANALLASGGVTGETRGSCVSPVAEPLEGSDCIADRQHKPEVIVKWPPPYLELSERDRVASLFFFPVSG